MSVCPRFVARVRPPAPDKTCSMTHVRGCAAFNTATSPLLETRKGGGEGSKSASTVVVDERKEELGVDERKPSGPVGAGEEANPAERRVEVSADQVL